MCAMRARARPVSSPRVRDLDGVRLAPGRSVDPRAAPGGRTALPRLPEQAHDVLVPGAPSTHRGDLAQGHAPSRSGDRRRTCSARNDERIAGAKILLAPRVAEGVNVPAAVVTLRRLGWSRRKEVIHDTR
jgi:hypothetical protein